MSLKVKKRLFEILEVGREDDLHSRIFDIFLIALISLSVLAVILETIDSLAARYMTYFWAFEVFSVTIFSIEYISRLWTCTIDHRFKSPVKGRVRFAMTPLLLIDLIAILPSLLWMFIPYDLRFIRILRFFRLLRVFKMARYSETMRSCGNILRGKKEDLVIAFSLVLIVLILSSSFMYFVEGEAQPEKFSSIPASMWWGIVTLTTVGYGDIYPITPLGRFLGAVIALLGIGMFAIPAGILASGFVEEAQKKKSKRKQMACPHCGHVIPK